VKTEIQQRLQLFVDNTRTLKKGFTWHSTLTRRLAALLFASENRQADAEAVKQCHRLIKESTGVFSTFRGNLSICIAALLSLSNDPKPLLDNTIKVYDLLKVYKLRASDFLVVAAYQIASGANPEKYVDIVKRTRAFYDGLKKNHRFYTGQDDYIFTAMLGLSDLDVNDSVYNIEKLFLRFKNDFSNKNSIQALSQILVLSESTNESIDRLLELRESLKARKMRYDKAYTLPSLGVLALLPLDNTTILNDLDESQAFLRGQKGFSSLAVSRQELLLYITGIVASEYLGSAKSGVSTSVLSTAITNIIIAQQAALIAAISATGASSAAASS